MLLSSRSVVRASLAALAALTLVGAQSARAHHVPGDDHTGTLLSGPSADAVPGKQALFSTRAQAEAAAAGFNCEGAHRMGNHWMPCSGHGAH